MVALSKSMVDVILAGYQAHKGRHDTYNTLNISSPCYVIVRCLKEETLFSKSFHKSVQENPIFRSRLLNWLLLHILSREKLFRRNSIEVGHTLGRGSLPSFPVTLGLGLASSRLRLEVRI